MKYSYHLANKIKETKINEEVDNYLPAINDVLQGIDREELIKKIISVEFTRFFNYYNKTQDLNTSDSRERGDREDRGRSRDGDSRIPADGNVRYFINVGEKDGYDWMTLKDFLRDTVNLGKDDIFKVDVKDSFSFFNTDASATEAILKTFTEFKVDGRFVNVEVSKSPGGGSGGGRGRRDRSRSGGGRDSRDNDRNKGRRRDRSDFKGSSASSSGKRRTKRKSDSY